MNSVRMIVREKNKNKKQLDFKSGFENPKKNSSKWKCCHSKKQTKYTYYYRVSHQYCPTFETLCKTCPATTAKPIFGISERIIKKCENKAFKSLHMYIKCH